MATVKTNREVSYTLILSECEAFLIKGLTQNSLTKESIIDRDARQSIFNELTNAMNAPIPETQKAQNIS